MGEELHLTSAGDDGRMYRMAMKKGDPNYRITRTRKLFATPGTELLITPLLSGIRQFSGEKIKGYLASELRDRIRRSQVQIRIVDRTARKEYRVRPKKFEGRSLPMPAADCADSSTAPEPAAEDGSNASSSQKKFFEYAGPLYRVSISPASSVVAVGKTRQFRALPRDRSNRILETDLLFQWEILEGAGELHDTDGEICTFQAADEPGLVKIGLTVCQHAVKCTAEALVTVADSLPERAPVRQNKGMPGYTFRRAPGELWRSRLDPERNLIVINSGHHDFVYASSTKALKLRYIVRLYSKELVLLNFPGYSREDLLEQMVELTLHTESHLK